ncbi:CBS domain-containing protein [Arenibaculum pallidiluteum]|uniref:CBS domain-containing protein n=1 Tax=Arenibaculum pallidiluteum TaxID=2812559 RepID=UPI001A96CED8|nr:CBS domain-containing protein [Arenibaculum pallidiluteum]
MAQGTDEPKGEVKNQAARTGDGPQTGGKGEARRSEETRQIEAAAGRMAEAARTGAHAAGDALRHGGQALDRASSQGADTTRRLTEEAGRRTARGQERTGAAAREVADAAAEQLERVGEAMARATRDAADNARTMMAFSSVAADGLRGLQGISTQLAERVVETNVRIAQALMNQTNPGEYAAIQQRFVREYLEALSRGTEEFLRAVQSLGATASGDTSGQGGRQQARVADVMSHEVRLVRADETVQQAARVMAEIDAGILPVAEGDRLVGMLTDRDIAVRAIAQGRDPAKTAVRDVMSADVRYCYEDEDLGHVAANMAEQRLRRLPVMNRNKRLVGILSLGDLAQGQPSEKAGQALSAVSTPGGPHSGAQT